MLKFWLCPALEKPLKDYSATTIQRWKLAEEKMNCRFTEAMKEGPARMVQGHPPNMWKMKKINHEFCLSNLRVIRAKNNGHKCEQSFFTFSSLVSKQSLYMQDMNLTPTMIHDSTNNFHS